MLMMSMLLLLHILLILMQVPIADLPERSRPRWPMRIKVLVEPSPDDASRSADAANLDAFAAPSLLTAIAPLVILSSHRCHRPVQTENLPVKHTDCLPSHLALTRHSYRSLDFRIRIRIPRRVDGARGPVELDDGVVGVFCGRDGCDFEVHDDVADGFVSDELIAGFRGWMLECCVGEVEGVEVVVVEEADDLSYQLAWVITTPSSRIPVLQMRASV